MTHKPNREEKAKDLFESERDQAIFLRGCEFESSLVEAEKKEAVKEYVDRLIKRIKKSKTISGLVKTHIYVLLPHQDK